MGNYNNLKKKKPVAFLILHLNIILPVYYVRLATVWDRWGWNACKYSISRTINHPAVFHALSRCVHKAHTEDPLS